MLYNFPPFLATKKPFSLFRVALVLTLGIIVAAIGQDAFQSWRNNYSFYLSESLLFKVYWILFAPITYIGLRLRESIWQKHIVPAIWVSIIGFVCFSIVLHALLFSVSVYALSVLFFDHTYSVVENLTYTFSNDSMTYLVVYGGIGFMILPLWETEWKQSQTTQELYPLQPSFSGTARGETVRHILVGTTKHRIAVPFDDIVCITSSAPYISIYTEKKKYLHNETLKAVQEVLPREQFVRIHKSTIVQIQKVVSSTSRFNGDYDIVLTNGQTVRLSRNYAKEFKKRFERSIHS